MVADTHMHDHSHPHSHSHSHSHFHSHSHSVRDTIKKRKRASDGLSNSPPTTHATLQRQHVRKSSLNNRSFSINTRRSLDFVRPVDLGARCYDWLVLPKGVHFARNKSWFNDAEYTGINVSVTGAAGQSLWVQGIGTVKLDIRTSVAAATHTADATTALALGNPRPMEPGFVTLTLRNVLHVPKAFCNAMSMPMIHEALAMTTNLSGDAAADIGANWMTTPFMGLTKLCLLGDAVGESPLRDMLDDDDDASTSANLLDLSLCLSDADVQRINAVVSRT